jgi:hypothetical protein
MSLSLLAPISRVESIREVQWRTLAEWVVDEYVADRRGGTRRASFAFVHEQYI